MSKKHPKDMYGKEIKNGDTFCFSFGIPPTLVKGKVRKTFIVETSGHFPEYSLLSEIQKSYEGYIEEKD